MGPDPRFITLFNLWILSIMPNIYPFISLKQEFEFFRLLKNRSQIFYFVAGGLQRTSTDATNGKNDQSQNEYFHFEGIY